MSFGMVLVYRVDWASVASLLLPRSAGLVIFQLPGGIMPQGLVEKSCDGIFGFIRDYESGKRFFFVLDRVKGGATQLDTLVRFDEQPYRRQGQEPRAENVEVIDGT